MSKSSSPTTPVDEGKLGGENDRQFLNSLVTKPTDAWTTGEMNRLAWMALAMQERLARSATSLASRDAVLEEAAIQALACMNPEPRVSASQVHHDSANVMARKIAGVIRSMKGSR